MRVEARLPGLNWPLNPLPFEARDALCRASGGWDKIDALQSRYTQYVMGRQRIARFLQSASPKTFCDDCLARCVWPNKLPA